MTRRSTALDLRLLELGRDGLCFTLATLIGWLPAVVHAQDFVARESSVARDFASHEIDPTDAEFQGDLGVTEGVVRTTRIDRTAVTEEVSEALEERADAPVEATPISGRPCGSR